MDLYQQVIHKSRYAKWLAKYNRRETWDETVDRYIEFWLGRFPQFEFALEEARDDISNLRVMPSMRALMTAGPALDAHEVCGYNCAFLAIDHPRAFDEIMYILMCGAGVGFSVERQHIASLPAIAESHREVETTIVVSDSKIGWCSAYRQLVSLLYAGQVPKLDLSRVRPKGSPLKTMGGRASGPEPLESLFRFAIVLFRRAAGRKLSSIEVHDLICKSAESIVVGGVRRSALISLSNLSDDRMRLAKMGQWWQDAPHRKLANNSYVLTERPEFNVFLEEWVSLYASKSGERGLFSLPAVRAKCERIGRDPEPVIGCNPCSEILLRSKQFCNLTEVVLRPGLSKKELARRTRVATFLGTLQSTLTDFKYLRAAWKQNCEEERLLGVSLTGILDCDSEALGWLKELRIYATETNAEFADRLSIPPSAAITCVKPSGTVSQLVNASSGMHARFAPYYIRRVRFDASDPLVAVLQAAGIPNEPENQNPLAVVFSFPIASPEGAVVESNRSAIEQMRLWGRLDSEWCDHKPSATIYYRDSEFLDLGAELWDKLATISGVAFFPRSDHIYEQAPYEEIDEATYKALRDAMPTEIDWDTLTETQDNTTATRELACAGNTCEIVGG